MAVKRTARAALLAIAILAALCVLPVFGQSSTFLSNGSSASSTAGSTLLFSTTVSSGTSITAATRNATGQSGALFQSDFDVYKVELVSVLPANDAVAPYLRVSTDGGTNYDSGANYGFVYGYELLQGATGHGAEGANPDVAMVLGGGQTDNDATYGGFSGTFEVWNPLSTTSHKMFGGQFVFKDNRDGVPSMRTWSGTYKSTSPINALQLTFSSGNVARGTMLAYGIKP